MATINEFKFACPVCGQHITCDSRSSGTQMECPTCFRKLVVPRATTSGSPNLVLTASEVSTRPVPQSGAAAPLAGSTKKQFPYAVVAFVIVLSIAAGSAYVFRDQLLKAVHNGNESASKKLRKDMTPPANDTNWMLKLAGVRIPDAPAAGRIHGEDFLVHRVTLQDGTLNFRQGTNWPPDLGFSLYLFANRGEDLAGQSIKIETTRTNSPRVVLRWKNDQQQAATKSYRKGYALRLEFGQVSGKRMPGRIYLCTPDAARSYVAGTFTAEIRKSPPKNPASPPEPKP